jgi:hypothetical protein
MAGRVSFGVMTVAEQDKQPRSQVGFHHRGHEAQPNWTPLQFGLRMCIPARIFNLISKVGASIQCDQLLDMIIMEQLCSIASCSGIF